MSMKVYLLPRDRSLQAFKEWMQSMTFPLDPKVKNRISTKQWIDEEGWVANWKAFWAKVDGASKPQKPGQE